MTSKTKRVYLLTYAFLHSLYTGGGPDVLCYAHLQRHGQYGGVDSIWCDSRPVISFIIAHRSLRYETRRRSIHKEDSRLYIEKDMIDVQLEYHSGNADGLYEN